MNKFFLVLFTAMAMFSAFSGWLNYKFMQGEMEVTAAQPAVKLAQLPDAGVFSALQSE